jgi:hypothetical protein
MLKKARLLTRPPQRAETRFVPDKAAASEEARCTLRCVEPLSDARTPLADFLSILLVLHCAASSGIGRRSRVGSGAFAHQRREFGELVHPLV